MRARYAYNTNGLAHHRLDDAVSMLADEGYAGVALTLDVQHLDPFADDALRQAEVLRRLCDSLGLGIMVETGARFLLDPLRKHQPTLVSPTPEGRARRLAFLRRCCGLADVLGAEAVSFWATAAARRKCTWMRRPTSPSPRQPTRPSPWLVAWSRTGGAAPQVTAVTWSAKSS